jgi:hypothetical protein
MITYRCDRCGTDTEPEKFFDVELAFKPHQASAVDASEDADVKFLGQCCDECTDGIAEHAVIQVASYKAASDDAPAVPTNFSTKDLAQLIARELFVNAGGHRAHRLVLTVDEPNPNTNLGGWSETAAADAINKLLVEVRNAQ